MSRPERETASANVPPERPRRSDRYSGSENRREQASSSPARSLVRPQVRAQHAPRERRPSESSEPCGVDSVVDHMGVSDDRYDSRDAGVEVLARIDVDPWPSSCYLKTTNGTKTFIEKAFFKIERVIELAEEQPPGALPKSPATGYDVVDIEPFTYEPDDRADERDPDSVLLKESNRIQRSDLLLILKKGTTAEVDGPCSALNSDVRELEAQWDKFSTLDLCRMVHMAVLQNWSNLRFSTLNWARFAAHRLRASDWRQVCGKLHIQAPLAADNTILTALRVLVNVSRLKPLGYVKFGSWIDAIVERRRRKRHGKKPRLPHASVNLFRLMEQRPNVLTLAALTMIWNTDINKRIVALPDATSGDSDSDSGGEDDDDDLLEVDLDDTDEDSEDDEDDDREELTVAAPATVATAGSGGGGGGGGAGPKNTAPETPKQKEKRRAREKAQQRKEKHREQKARRLERQREKEALKKARHAERQERKKERVAERQARSRERRPSSASASARGSQRAPAIASRRSATASQRSAVASSRSTVAGPRSAVAGPRRASGRT